ncbi:MAG: GTPase ObgE [Anaerolineales bacterium]|nr:GTPase ObgE [Anaerolineales bacterium]
MSGLVFIDEAEIIARSGKGGDGMLHFRREKYVPRGGPDGGDGGHGGDVVFVVDPKLSTLASFRNKKMFVAADGLKGGPNNRTGRSQDPVTVRVPPGTLVFDAQSGDLLGDLVERGQELVVCKGGRGGRGNSHFASSRNQTPQIAERGEPGEEKNLRLELKVLADVGVVGAPNAGKSTFLAAVTNARPKIGAYPFTTLAPNLGVAELDEEVSLVLADIPGLIEGAHEGAGLGHSFLRHIQRTRVLIHLLDGLAEDPLADFSQINTELALFDPELGDKPQVVALNKVDLPDVMERWPELERQLKQKGYEPFHISAAAGTNVRGLLFQAYQVLQETPVREVSDELPVYRYDEDPEAFEIVRRPDGWQVVGAAIERAAAMTYWEHDQSVRRFQRILQALGVEEGLREAGVAEGDTVIIGEYTLEWHD